MYVHAPIQRVFNIKAQVVLPIDSYGSHYYQIKSVEFVGFDLYHTEFCSMRTSSMMTTVKIMIDICKVVVEVNKH